MLLSENKTISSDLKCLKCNETYNQPCRLPCGHSFCTYCIEVTGTELSNEFKCISCQHTHLIPAKGFPIDQTLRNELKIANFLQKMKIFQFKSHTDKIQTNLKQTEFEIDNGDHVIAEFCRELKDQVQLAKERKIKELEDLSQRTMTQIDILEQMKLKAFLNANKAEFNLKLEEIKQTLLNCNNHHLIN